MRDNAYACILLFSICKNGMILEHEPVIHPRCSLSASDDSLSAYVGAINTISTEQLIEKFREQAAVVGFSKKKIG